MELMKELGLKIIPFYQVFADMKDVLAEIKRIGALRGSLPI